MKNLKFYLLSLLALCSLGLTSCSNAGDLNEDESTPDVTETETETETESTPDVTGSWDNDIKEIMNIILGEELPFFAFEEYSLSYGVASDYEGPYLFLMDNSETNTIQNYGNVLKANGFTYDFMDSSYGYDAYYYTKGNIKVQYEYYPGDDEYYPGNEIYAWVSDYPGYSNTEWTDDIEALMELFVGTVIPFVALDTDTLTIEGASEYFWIYDLSSTNVLSNYGDTLEEAGYTYVSTDDTYGYDIVTYCKGDIYVDYSYYPGDDEYSPSNDIMFYISN